MSTVGQRHMKQPPAVAAGGCAVRSLVEVSHLDYERHCVVVGIDDHDIIFGDDVTIAPHGGHALDDVLRGMRMVAEGVRTTAAALALGEKHGIELPITAEMAAVLGGRRTPRDAVEALMGRRQRAEADR